MLNSLKNVAPGGIRGEIVEGIGGRLLRLIVAASGSACPGLEIPGMILQDLVAAMLLCNFLHFEEAAGIAVKLDMGTGASVAASWLSACCDLGSGCTAFMPPRGSWLLQYLPGLWETVFSSFREREGFVYS
jgi:hypothetical protein